MEEILEKKFILPFRILIETRLPDSKEVYDEHGNLLIDLRRPRQARQQECARELSFETYQQLISIKYPDDAKDFLKQNDYFPFVYKDDPYSRARELMIERQYYRLVSNLISRYNTVREMIFDYKDYLENPSDDLREKILDAYVRLYGSITRPKPIMPNYNSAYKFYQSQYFSLRDEGDKAGGMEEYVKSRMLDDANDAVKRYLSTICTGLSIVLNVEEMAFDCICPDLYVAMHLMTLVVLHRNSEFSICQHPHCNRYYIVDPHYRQTLCPIHMAQRRERKERYKEKSRKKELGIEDD